MSRTDVHAPHWVKEQDPGWAHAFREDHNHEAGICDLDVYRAACPHRYWPDTYCHISTRWTGRNIHCGCRMCTMQGWRLAANRRERGRWRRERARVLALVDREDVDVPPLRVYW